MKWKRQRVWERRPAFDGFYGTLFVDEIGMPVRKVSFAEGLTYLWAEAPVRNMPEGKTNVRFHALDGSVIFVAEVDWPEVEVEGWADTLTIQLPIHFESASLGEPWARSKL